MYDPSHVIPAECHSDDRCVEIQFDAQSYFEWSSDETLLELAECGFGSDYPADRVAEFRNYGANAKRTRPEQSSRFVSQLPTSRAEVCHE